ncbi:von Willebrand factor-like [Scyliorhinus canicula]|uniref:von Willebrand factor-like n=1 Tax=Scyliorhinus canicula TaxID=7830 RepID=UPI0018F2FA56|nr:von Willebrand factor-like [Scyliorhinus canicula]
MKTSSKGSNSTNELRRDFSCDKSKCPAPPKCNKHGEVPIHFANSDHSCCTITTCGIPAQLFEKKFQENPATVKKSHSQYFPLSYQNVDRVCPFNDTTLKPGQVIHQKHGPSCTTFRCVRRGRRLTLTTSKANCPTTCDEGFALMRSEDTMECCEQCVQEKCIYTAPGGSKSILLEVGQTYEPDKCTKVFCEKENGNLVFQEIKEFCPPDMSAENCNGLGGTHYMAENGCCSLCSINQKIPSCNITVKSVNIVEGICSAQVAVSVCAGDCTSLNPVVDLTATNCSLCLPQNSKSTNVTLTCANGGTRIHTVTEPVSCQCTVKDC